MEHPSKKAKTQHDDMLEYLKVNTELTKVQESEYTSVKDTIFFNNPSTHSFTAGDTLLPIEYLEFMDTYSFPMRLKLFWIILGNINDEIKTPLFTLMSLKRIYDDKDTYKGFIDIGIQYRGMGHVFVLAVDKKTGMLFIRPDGGSNGYEREMYYNYYSTVTPSKDFKKFLIHINDITDILKMNIIPDTTPIVKYM
jgi:hypothetical protein